MKLISFFWLVSLSTMLACANEAKPKAPEGDASGAEEDHEDHEDDADDKDPASAQNDGDNKDDGNPDGSDPDDSNDPGGSEDATLSCDQQWERYVAANKVGRKETYEITSSGGVEIYLVEIKSTSSIEVLESSDAKVVVKSTYEDQGSSDPVTKNYTTTKSDFLASCNAQGDRPEEGDKDDNTAQFESKKLGERNESKTVRAGDFDCKYLKMQYEMSSGDSRSVDVIESWTSTEYDVVVYQTSKTTYVFEGEEQEVTSTSELIAFEPGG